MTNETKSEIQSQPKVCRYCGSEDCDNNVCVARFVDFFGLTPPLTAAQEAAELRREHWKLLEQRNAAWQLLREIQDALVDIHEARGGTTKVEHICTRQEHYPVAIRQLLKDIAE